MLPSPLTLHLPCARGTEHAVEHEVLDLGVPAAQIVVGSSVVTVKDAALDLIPRANVFSRCASRVLVELARFEGVAGADDLVERLGHIPYEERLDSKGTFAVDAHLRNAEWTHERYAAQRVKDVVVDRLRGLGRGRPDVDTARPSLRYVLHWDGPVATLSLDTSGDSLFQRGYRKGVEGKAPMKETLAASILAMAHADINRAFLDPCCGTGTLVVEQAWRSMNRAPGRDRRFGFERWSKRPAELDRALALARSEARDGERKAPLAPIRASDWHADAVDACVQCLDQAGVVGHVLLERVDARRAEIPPGGVVCSNLPFGERLAQNRLQLDGFYRTLGERFAAHAGLRVILFTAHPGARGLLNLDEVAQGGRTPRARHWKLWSGPIEAHVYRWDLPTLT